MPRYKATVEFDHPGDGQAVDGGYTNNPAKWNWSKKLVPEARNIVVKIEEYPATQLIDRGTQHYPRGFS